VLVARPPVSDFTRHPSTGERARLRAEQRDVAFALIDQYNPDAVICVGIPFGHTPAAVDRAARAPRSPSTVPPAGSSPTTRDEIRAAVSCPGPGRSRYLG